MTLCFIPFNFPPKEGGVHTWLYSICTNLNDDEIFCLVEQVEKAEEFDRRQSFNIIRESVEPEIGFGVLLRHVWSICKHLWRHTTYSLNNKRSFHCLMEVVGCLIRMNFVQLVYFIQLLYAWVRSGDKKKSDAVFCGLALPPGLIALVLNLLFNTPYIVFAHGAELLSWQKQKYQRILMKKVFQYAHKIIANSHYTRSILINLGIEEKKVVVIHPSVNIEKYHPGIDTSYLLNKLQLTNAKVILTVGHLEERKGQDMVIKALPHVLKEVPGVKYVIVGQGPYKQKLEWLVNELNLNQNVIFAGYVTDEDLPEYFNSCHVFIMPSRLVGNSVEGFGISYIEASACGKPAVGGKSGGIEDAILDGVTGYLVEPTDVEQISKTLILLLKDDELAKTLGQNGRRRVEQELSWKAVAQKVRHMALEISN